MFKKLLVVLVAVALTAGYAQAQLTFGARAGLNFTNIGRKGAKDLEASMKPGFQIGAVADYALSDAFSIQPGLLFSQQGYKMKGEIGGEEWGGEPGDETTLTITENVNYLQIPINAQYKLDVSGMKLLLQAGPYIGFAIGRKTKMKGDGATIKDKIEFGSGDEASNKRGDFGAGLGAGLQFGNIQAGVGYNISLANTSTVDDAEFKLTNNGLVLTVTYLFGK